MRKTAYLLMILLIAAFATSADARGPTSQIDMSAISEVTTGTGPAGVTDVTAWTSYQYKVDTDKYATAVPRAGPVEVTYFDVISYATATREAFTRGSPDPIATTLTTSAIIDAGKTSMAMGTPRTPISGQPSTTTLEQAAPTFDTIICKAPADITATQMMSTTSADAGLVFGRVYTFCASTPAQRAAGRRPFDTRVT